ncbi:MAG: diaminobutyrate--2-oxoglutarate transaminase, partial [Brevibacterium aurantiacum]|nr:diaminobutyrate--2-oxoglutarate transaminase [Brevibacterium aurantiacum]
MTENSKTTKPDIFETRESEVRGYSRSWPATFAKAQGAKQWGEDGKEFIDFFSGAGALNYGHNNPVVMNPLVEYLQSGAVLHSLDMKTPAKREFLETF